MNADFYEYNRTDLGNTYSFVSRGRYGDMPKVIATVLKIAMEFMIDNPDVLVIFQGYADGKTDAVGRNQRNVLYQRVIESNWDELSRLYRIYGVKDGEQVEYLHRGCYDAILIASK